MKPLKVAVIGAGHLGKIHARIYSQCKAAQLIGICDIDEEKAKARAQDFSTNSFTNYKQLLGKADAVSIATPTGEHFRIANDFLKHNVHVLIEKPITTSITDAEKLINLAKKNKLILQVGHVERFNPAIKTLQRLCENPQFIECHRLSPYPKRSTDVSVVLDLMIHDLDIILALVKSPIKNHTVCNITASRVSDEVLRKIRIFQKDSYISLDYASQKIIFYQKKSSQVIKKELAVEKKEPLAEELVSFIQCIKKGSQPVVCGKDAKEALQVALTIIKQIRQNAKNHYHHCR